jgi:hypothetical protein
MSAFYLLLDGEEKGPFSADEVAVMVRKGIVGGDAGIRPEDEEGWHLVSEAKFEDIVEASPDENPLVRRAGVGLAIITAVLLLLVIGGAFRRGGNPPQNGNAIAQQSADEDPRQNVIEDAVRVRLKSASAATFIWRKKSDEMWMGFVDTQNGAGVLTRSVVTVTNLKGVPAVSITKP